MWLANAFLPPAALAAAPGFYSSVQRQRTTAYPAMPLASSHPTAKQSAETKGEKLALRLSGILARLHQGEALDKHQLVQQFDVDVRTIERDLYQRLEGIAERNADGLWQLAKASRATVPTSHLHSYARLTGAEHVFPDTSLRYLLEQLEFTQNCSIKDDMIFRNTTRADATNERLA